MTGWAGGSRWAGTPAQRASVKKASEASARIRQMYSAANVTSGGALRTSPPKSQYATMSERLRKGVHARPQITVEHSSAKHVGPPTLRALPGGGIKQGSRDMMSKQGNDLSVLEKDRLSSQYNRHARRADALFRSKD